TVMRGTAYGGSSHFRFAPSRAVLQQYAEILDDDGLRARAASDLFWDRIIAIEPSGEEEVFDLTVPVPASWLPVAIVSHNRAVFACDPHPSVASATEEILFSLVLAGSGALGYSRPLGIGIAALTLIVMSSYRQTLRAYPEGGGAYSVAKDNLGVFPSLVAAAALLIDYVLTVAVSVAAGVAAVTSAVPELFPYRTWLCVVAV